MIEEMKNWISNVEEWKMVSEAWKGELLVKWLQEKRKSRVPGGAETRRGVVGFQSS